MIRALLVCVAFVLASPAAAQDRITPSDRVTTHVRIRAAAGETATEIGQLHIGEGLPLVRSLPRWYEVRLSESQTGFVSKSWTSRSIALAPRQTDELRMHFLNIGAGTCTVVECPGAGARPMIVDCGSLGGAAGDLTVQETRTYVRGVLANHSAEPNVVFSHADADHYNRIPAILDDIDVATIWQGGDPSRYTVAGFPAWLAGQQGRGAVVRQGLPAHFHNDRQPVSADLSCGTASTFVLTVGTGDSENARSLVLMIEHGDFTAVFTGDAEGTTEAQAITNFAQAVKASVMTASHHGASTNGSNSVLWADTTAPAVLVSSAGDRFFHPRCAATERFTALVLTKAHDTRCGTSSSYVTTRTGRAHYVTAVVGAVIVTSSGVTPMTVHCTRSVECGVRIVH